MTVPMIIDTDPGVDDAMAILYALAEPEIDLIGLTTVFGNVSEPEAARNARALLELAGAALPVASGAARPLRRKPAPFAHHVHGPTGLGRVELKAPQLPLSGDSAADFLARSCAERPGEIVIVAVGPLTNLALALEAHPEIAKTAGRVIVMGGAVREPGNVTPHAEANIWQDPEAAARVLAADWPLTLVGLDVTTRVVLTPVHLAPIAAAAPVTGGFLAEAVPFYFDFHAAELGLDGCHFHDPTAVMAAVAPELLSTEDLAISVTLDGDEIGRTTETGPGRIATCLGVDGPAVLARFSRALTSGLLP